MRSEHKTTADEWDAFTGWRRVLVSMQRAGIRKGLKKKSHRIDRRRARQHLTAESDRPEWRVLMLADTAKAAGWI